MRNILVILLMFSVSYGDAAFNTTEETDLRAALFTNYDSTVRPLDKNEVVFGFHLLGLNELNIREQRLSTQAYVEMFWYDPRLMWNETEYPSTRYIFTSRDSIWKPQLVVYNPSNVISIIGSDQDSPYMMRVSSNGYIKWNPAAAFNTQCDADTTYYPYDTQSCNITIAVWLHSVDEVNVTLFNDGFYLANYQQDGEWELGSFSAARDEFYDAGQQYAKVDLTLNLKRRQSYYILNIIIPLILIGALNVFVFLYPPDPGTRSGFAITVLLTYYVLLTVVADKLPTTSRYVCILEVYITMLLFLSTICNLVSAGILRFHLHESPREPQRWLCILACRILAPMTCSHSKECLLCHQDSGRVTPSGIELGENDLNKKTAPETLFSDLTEYELNQRKWKVIAYAMDSFFFWMFLSVELLLTLVVFVLLQTH